jgi:hypothetical protein
MALLNTQLPEKAPQPKRIDQPKRGTSCRSTMVRFLKARHVFSQENRPFA